MGEAGGRGPWGWLVGGWDKRVVGKVWGGGGVPSISALYANANKGCFVTKCSGSLPLVASGLLHGKGRRKQEGPGLRDPRR